MKVEIWSDVVCPWCAIGRARLGHALERFDHGDAVEVVWRSFELDPTAPPLREGGLVDHLARKYGMSLEQAEASQHRLTQLAAEEGLDFRFDRARPGNTFDAHRLLHLAAQHGRQHELKGRLLRAYFTEGEAIGEGATLARLATEVGLDPDEVEAVLAGDAFAEAVRADEREATELGVSGVPFFVVDRHYGVSGAQPTDLLVEVLEQAWADAATPSATPSATVTGERADDGEHGRAEACDDDSCAT